MQHSNKHRKLFVILISLATILVVFSVFLGKSDDLPKGQLPLPEAEVIEIAPGIKAVKGVLLIFLKPEVSDSEIVVKTIATQTGGEIYGSLPEIHSYTLYYEVADMQALEDMKSRLSRYPEIDLVTLDLLVSGRTSPTVHSPGYMTGFKNWGIEYVRASVAWERIKNLKAPTVAVIDDGIEKSHIALSKNITKIVSPEGVPKEHGTHVTGIIAADYDRTNGVTDGVSGVCPHCNILFYSFYGDDGIPDMRYTLWRMTMAAIDGARIVNMSLEVGFSDPSTKYDNQVNRCDLPADSRWSQHVLESNEAFLRSIRYLSKNYADTLWIIAAGNECRDARLASPASVITKTPSNVVTVAAIIEDGILRADSNRGSIVSVAAPGDNIISTWPCNGIFSKLSCNNISKPIGGTSMAAPHVAGAAGLVLAKNPSLSSAQIKECIVKSARNRRVSGELFGIVDAVAAVDCGDTKIIMPATSSASLSDKESLIAKNNQLFDSLFTAYAVITGYNSGYGSGKLAFTRGIVLPQAELYLLPWSVWEEKASSYQESLSTFRRLFNEYNCNPTQKLRPCEFAQDAKSKEILETTAWDVDFSEIRKWRLNTRAYLYKYFNQFNGPEYHWRSNFMSSGDWKSLEITDQEINHTIDCAHVDLESVINAHPSRRSEIVCP